MDIDESNTLANRLNNSRLLSYLIGAIGVVYVVLYFHGGGSMDLNLINFIILFLGIILLGTPIRYGCNMRASGGICGAWPVSTRITACSTSNRTTSYIRCSFRCRCIRTWLSTSRRSRSIRPRSR